jgi:hypothetical protein
MISLTFDETTNTRAPLPTGWYAVQISEAEQTTSKAGNPMLKIVYAVLGNSDGEVVEGNRLLWEYVPLTANATFRIQRILLAVELIQTDSTDVQFEATDLIGTELHVYVTQEMYDNRTTNRVENHSHISHNH